MLHEQHAWLIIWYVTWATCMTYHLVCYMNMSAPMVVVAFVLLDL